MKWVVPLLLLSGSLSASANPTVFFNAHCVQCHGAEKQKGKLRLDTLVWNPEDAKNTEIWREIADRVQLGEMPPEDEPQPKAADTQVFLKALTARLAAGPAHRKPTVLRRLNRAQYRNTLEDLLGLDLSVEDPTEAFPADDKEEGFDNLGETLKMSDFLLRQYLKVARAAVDRATFPDDRPEAKTYRPGDVKGRPLNYKAQANDPDRDYLVLTKNDERAPGDPRGQAIINCREGAAHDGWYEFTYVVESKGRGNLAKVLREQRRNDYPVYFAEDLHRFEVYVTAPNSKSQIQTRPRKLVHAEDLPDNRRVTIKKRLWLPQGWRVEVGFGNGYWGVRDLLEIVDPKFNLDAFRELPRREQNDRYGKLLIDALEKVDGPRIVIHSIVETGPHYEQWPPQSHQYVYGKTDQNPAEVVRRFAERAFRRPVTDKDIAPYLALAKHSPEGIRTAIEGILCSPRFLYLREPAGVLDHYAIASRLSYFLWNTMPDAPLLADAQAGRLRDPKVLAHHLDRMLADPRSNEFVDTFLWAWLKLDNTVEMAPDPMKFYEFRRNRIAEAMVKESTLFFRNALDQNLPPTTFLDANFTFLNANLARHYGLAAAKVDTTARFRKVSLAGQSKRGGLLGQAAVLTASANGVDTSPVVRGIWILENLLGTPPKEPPPDVEVPEPDARGELTIRELYAKHRTVESCNDCHKKIDPLGFALENFDAVGAWRVNYESGHAIDSSGRMPNGKGFTDVAGLKQILIQEPNLFTRNLTTKLFTYATGRTMEAGDRPGIDRIVEDTLREQTGMKDLLRKIITSELFLNK